MSNPVVAFGLNKTLIKQNSWYELNLAMGISEQEDELLYRLGPEAESILSFKEWIGILEQLMIKRGQANRQKIEDVLLDYTYLDGVKETIAALKARGCKVGIITGAFDIVAQKVAADLGGLDFVHSNANMQFDNQNMLSGIHLENDNDFAFKAMAAAKLRKKYSDSEIYYVSDGDNDEEIFKVTRGILLDPAAVSHESWKQQAIKNGASFSAQRTNSKAWRVVASLATLINANL